MTSERPRCGHGQTPLSVRVRGSMWTLLSQSDARYRQRERTVRVGPLISNHVVALSRACVRKTASHCEKDYYTGATADVGAVQAGRKREPWDYEGMEQ